jgi:hypothetical protein
VRARREREGRARAVGGSVHTRRPMRGFRVARSGSVACCPENGEPMTGFIVATSIYMCGKGVAPEIAWAVCSIWIMDDPNVQTNHAVVVICACEIFPR